jgi:transposase
VTKTNLVILYKKEKDPKVKERLLLVIRVRADEQVPFRVVKEINRSNPWASYWLKRYDEEGIEGLKDRPKSGRHPKISRQTEYKIRTILKESNQGWTTKQVEQMIVEKTRVKYHYTHIYHVLRKWGFRQKVPRKVHVNTAIREEKEIFKKRPARFLWISNTTKRGKTLP